MSDGRAYVRVKRVLLVRVWDTLEALWDCSCDGSGQCERCRTLEELRRVL